MRRRRERSGDDLRRTAFVRLIVRWLGKPTPTDMKDVFGLSRAQAYRVLKAASESRIDESGMDRADVVLDFLRAQTLSDRLCAGLGLSAGVAVEDVDALLAAPQSEHIIGPLLQALRGRRALAVAYAGRKGASDRVISPARLVHVLGRYHVRAWDHQRRGFRDFVLSRITEAAIARERYMSPPDREWTEFLRLDFVVNPELPLGLRAALAAEWGLGVNGVRSIDCRKANARYVVRRLTERTAAGQRRWLPENEAARTVFNAIEDDVMRDEGLRDEGS